MILPVVSDILVDPSLKIDQSHDWNFFSGLQRRFSTELNWIESILNWNRIELKDFCTVRIESKMIRSDGPDSNPLGRLAKSFLYACNLALRHGCTHSALNGSTKTNANLQRLVQNIRSRYTVLVTLLVSVICDRRMWSAAGLISAGYGKPTFHNFCNETFAWLSAETSTFNFSQSEVTH